MLLLAACTGLGLPAAPAADPEAFASRASGIGMLVRAAHLCGIPLSQGAQDRAARIEVAAIAWQQSRGGVPARDAFLRAMAPPRFDGRSRKTEREEWCAARRPTVQELDGRLTGPEGDRLIEQAEAVQRRPG
ncbi:hypothetical protein [Roseicella frigidaeris]|uniref:TIGR02301 family protein n=1 Tax=Roseicella frigidaeris TaxID=2230885 RepID=A0A327MJB8_9PROT|nr:hypothetical protein [Roseicella frigidaeris]RAI60258.1 hypothetical protein DOO78_04065 [Roseicella frigidaeris]